VLERLGPPEEIVEAAEPAPVPSRRAVGAGSRSARWSLLVGIVLVLASQVWSNRDKAIGVAAGADPSVPAAPLIGVEADSGGTQPARGVDGGDVGGGASETGAIEATVFAVGILLAGLPSALFLWLRLRSLP
jgi:hypothetical protein